MPCVAELLRFVASLINPHDRQNTPTQIAMGLNLLIVALETGANHIAQSPALMEVRFFRLFHYRSMFNYTSAFPDLNRHSSPLHSFFYCPFF